MSAVLTAPVRLSTPTRAIPAAAGPGREPVRLSSLDVLRGATVAAMVLVNDPAMGPPYLYHQLTHSVWDGWTFADTIYPAFLFMVGMALPFSMSRHLDGRLARWRALPRIARRTILLFALGLLVNGFPLLLGEHESVLGHLRIPGVLQRIAIAYLLGAVIVVYLRPRYQILVTIGLLLGYWAGLEWISVPHFGAGALSPHGNLAAFVDRSIFGPAHMYGSGTLGYDPEGLLGSVVATAGVLAGSWAGTLMRARRPMAVTFSALASAGMAAIGLGYLWGRVLPINKRMWTPSYVLLMSGLALAALAVCHLLFDRPGRPAAWSSVPLRVLGTNAIVIYVGSELTAAALGRYHHAVAGIPNAPIPFWIWARYLVPHFGLRGGALAYAAAILAGWWVVLAVLYRLGLFVKV